MEQANANRRNARLIIQMVCALTLTCLALVTMATAQVSSGLNSTEGGAIGGGTGVDTLWADGTHHRWLMSNNSATVQQWVAAWPCTSTSPDSTGCMVYAGSLANNYAEQPLDIGSTGMILQVGTAAGSAAPVWSSFTLPTSMSSCLSGYPLASNGTNFVCSNTISSSSNPLIWDWALTGGQTGITFGETTAASGSSNVEVGISTMNGSNSTLLNITQGMGPGTASTSTAVSITAGSGGSGHNAGSALAVNGASGGSASPTNTGAGNVGSTLSLATGSGSNGGTTSGTGGSGGAFGMTTGNGGSGVGSSALETAAHQRVQRQMLTEAISYSPWAQPEPEVPAQPVQLGNFSLPDRPWAVLPVLLARMWERCFKSTE